MAKNKNLNVNSIDEQVFMILPGVGKVLTERILSARDERPFTSASDMADRVNGITEAFASEWFAFGEPDVKNLDSFGDLNFDEPSAQDEEEEEERQPIRWLRPVLIGLFLLLVAFGVFFAGRASKDTMAAASEQSAVVQEGPSSVIAETDKVSATEPEPTKVQEESSDSYEVPEGAVLIGGADNPIGHVIFPNLSEAPPVDVAVDEAGLTIIAFGEGKVNGYAVGPTAEDIGHVVLIRGEASDGTTPNDLNNTVAVSDYVPGHVAVTQIYKIWGEDGEKLHSENAVVNMLQEAPNCGANSCNEVYLWELQEDGLSLLEHRTSK